MLTIAAADLSEDLQGPLLGVCRPGKSPVRYRTRPRLFRALASPLRLPIWR